jgi:hypothetical protein
MAVGVGFLVGIMVNIFGRGNNPHGLTLLTFLNLSIDAYRSDRDIGI